MTSASQESGVERGQALEIPVERVAHFLRQVSHDVRNNLGSMDLQAAYVTELMTDPEAVAELGKLRAMITSTAKMLQTISRNFQAPKPNLVTLSASILLEDFHDRFSKLHPEESARMEWNAELGEEMVAVDIEMIFNALLECCRNAFHFREGEGKLRAHLLTTADQLLIELRQHRAVLDLPLEAWGLAPLVSTRRGGYGLGLFAVRQILTAHGGDLEFVHLANEATLITRVRLPLATAAAHA